jgi:hypothetical protein
MPFDWRVREEQALEQRFAGRITPDHPILGAEAWSRFIRGLEGQQANRVRPSDEDDLISAFQKFLVAIGPERRRNGLGVLPSTHPVVFVSHQRSDIAEAERIAEIACDERIDYWLDIHDPILKFATQTVTPSDARYPFIIAAIIEMALLNCSHLIAVHTINSLASKWVPYELGRVRNRHIQSANAGGWFHPNLLPRQCGDYVHLCRMAQGGEYDVTRWLRAWSAGRGAPWQHNPTMRRLP